MSGAVGQSWPCAGCGKEIAPNGREVDREGRWWHRGCLAEARKRWRAEIKRRREARR